MPKSYRNVSSGGDTSKTQSNAAVGKGGTPLLGEDFPIEVTMLLDVLARIESRRQAKLLDVRKEAC